MAEVGLVTVNGGAHEKVAAALQDAMSNVLSPTIIVAGLPVAEYIKLSLVMVTEPVTLHPEESVTVTLYVPADKPDMLFVVCPPGAHK